MLCLHNCCLSKPHLINTSHSRILFSETQLIINPLNVLFSANKYIPSLLLSLNYCSICFISFQFLPIFKVEINIILYYYIMFLKTNCFHRVYLQIKVLNIKSQPSLYFSFGQILDYCLQVKNYIICTSVQCNHIATFYI